MSKEEVEKLERQLGWIKEYPHCVYITLIRGISVLIAIYVTMTFVAFVFLKIIQEHSQNDLTRKIF